MRNRKIASAGAAGPAGRGRILALVTVAAAAVLTACGGRPGEVAPAGGTAAAVPAAGAQAPRLITLPEPESPFIAFNIWVRTGSQDDPAGKEGLAALTAAVMAGGGTATRSYEQIMEALYPMAAGYGQTVDREMTTFTGRVHRDNLDHYYDLFRAAILEPAFDESDFERVKTNVLNTLERARRYTRDEELSKDLLFWMAFQGTPYAHPEDGYVQSVRAITLDDVRAFHRERYTRDNVVVAVGGGYPAGFPERVRSDFDRLPAGRVATPPAPSPSQPQGMRVLLVETNTDATAISMGFPVRLHRGDDDFIAMVAANSWFGEHRNSFSHLYQVIRETRGMNYGSYTYIEAFPRGFATQQPRVNVARRSQLFEIWIRPIAETAPGNLHDRSLFATRAAIRELDRLVGQGMSPAQVDATVTFLRNYSVNWGNTISRRLAYQVDDAFYGVGGNGFLASIRPGLDALTPAAVNAAIRRHLDRDGMYLVMITRDAEGLRQKLLSGEPTPIAYAGTQPDHVLAEDREIASYPIPVRPEDVSILRVEEVFEGR
jgi:zinc protease